MPTPQHLLLLAAIVASLLCPSHAGAQQLPTFLQGDWIADGKNSFEHWDKLNDNNLKGFSYSKKGESIQVMEYMDILVRDGRTRYDVQIPEQHDGQTFSFTQRVDGQQWIYENKNNDFPKTVIYERRSDDEIQIYLSNDERQVTYSLKRIRPMQDALTDKNKTNE